MTDDTQPDDLCLVPRWLLLNLWERGDLTAPEYGAATAALDINYVSVSDRTFGPRTEPTARMLIRGDAR